MTFFLRTFTFISINLLSHRGAGIATPWGTLPCNYKSIYRLILITHENWCPVDGAIAGDCRAWCQGAWLLLFFLPQFALFVSHFLLTACLSPQHAYFPKKKILSPYAISTMHVLGFLPVLLFLLLQVCHKSVLLGALGQARLSSYVAGLGIVLSRQAGSAEQAMDDWSSVTDIYM